MSTKITSLKFTNPRKKKIVFKTGEDVQYEIYWNANNDASTLDISIHDLLTSEINKSFNYEINDSDAIDPGIESEDVVIAKNSDEKVTPIYQFSINFSDFKISADNVVTIFDVTDDSTAIGSIEFFTQADNSLNIKLERPGIESTPDQILWDKIIEHMLDFREYEVFIDTILCTDDTKIKYHNENFFR